MTAAGSPPSRRSRRPPWRNVTIVGVGLIGGSLGLALKHADASLRVTGLGRREKSLKAARRAGAIDSGTTSVATGVADADIVVICAPVGAIVSLATQAANACPPGAIITDAGSVKGSIVSGIADARRNGEFPSSVGFVGGHPIAGGEQSGPEAATVDLFHGREVILTPTGGKRAAAAAKTIAEMWKRIGARVTTMSPVAHDRALAAASHLPHVVAAALSASLTDKQRAHSAGGLADTTRIAAGDPELWREIFTSNDKEVLAAIDRFQTTLARLRESVATNNQRQLTSILRKAKRNRDAL